MALPFFDAHLHVIDPAFALVPNGGYVPDPYPVETYRVEAARLLGAAGFVPRGGAVVAGSFQGLDPAPLEAALAELGAGYVAVAQLDPQTPDAELQRLHTAGVRALRGNLVRRADTDVEDLVDLALRARVLVGWHLELYVDAADLPELLDLLPDPDGLVVDHLGLSAEGLPALVHLCAEGARVKATGFSRGDLDVPAALRKLHTVNPEGLMAGTDLPCTRAPRRVEPADLTLLQDVFPDPDDLAAVTYENARSLYLRAV